ncbi:pyrethroid hydrolase Ces2e-like [Carcharodon carcharias]|uniref:pyrethroid hydrolase Ces2e-like n=1 Tax=Carcharodon carcharias TaxID=13397 RepID=UPI001B7DB259|nr:pyrethroid hydrolase Ces2e-like [Carcharodon carcharias]
MAMRSCQPRVGRQHLANRISAAGVQNHGESWPKAATQVAEKHSIPQDSIPHGTHGVSSLVLRLVGGNYLHPIVKIEDGLLRGKQLEVEGSPRTVFGYIGIPFAAPPVGSLRFAPPKRPQPWTGIRNARSYPPMCLQKTGNHLPPFSVPASEDCLYLSVYTPAHPLHQNSSLPVMVWIHGGAFILGSGSVFHGTALAGYGNVVVVVIQYRISVAGFLSTGDNNAQGNFGFLDQLAALQWVQRNILQFGGNPGLVTLFGESVGGLSVSLHTLSPLSTGLFHKAILQSGSALMPGLVPPLPTQLAHEAAEIAGCGNTQSQLLLQCLRNKTEEEMAQITTSLNELYQLIPALVVDGHFLPDDPQKMFQNGMFQKIPYLIGVTTEEAVKSLVHPEKIIPSDWAAGLTEKQIKEKINTYLTPIFGDENGDLIFDEYFKDVHDPDVLKERYLDMFGDVFIAFPTLRAAQYYKDAGNPVFLYEFQHRASFYEARIPQFKRAPHGAELSFVLGGPFIPTFDILLGNMTEGEKNLSKAMMSYWSTFAWSGNPNRNDLPVWPMNGDSEKYMQFNLTLQLGKKLKKDKLKFWSNKPPKIVAKVLI